MLHGMEFGDIEIFSETKFDKHVLVQVKCVKASLHCIQGLQSVQLELRIIDKVRQSVDDCQNTVINIQSTSEQSNKDTLHLLVFGTCPLRYEGDSFFEMP